jgi:hypothetical protein
MQPRYSVAPDGTVTYEYDPEYILRKYEVLQLRVYHRCVCVCVVSGV